MRTYDRRELFRNVAVAGATAAVVPPLLPEGAAGAEPTDCGQTAKMVANPPPLSTPSEPSPLEIGFNLGMTRAELESAPVTKEISAQVLEFVREVVGPEEARLDRWASIRIAEDLTLASVVRRQRQESDIDAEEARKFLAQSEEFFTAAASPVSVENQSTEGSEPEAGAQPATTPQSTASEPQSPDAVPAPAE